MKVNGRMINNMGKAKNLGLMVLFMKDIMKKVKNTDMESLNLEMDPNMKEISYITISMEKVSMNGQTVKNMMVITNMIKNTAMVFLNGMMEEDMKEIGKME